MAVALKVEWEFGIEPPVADVEEFHAVGSRLMDELLKLEGCNDGVHDSTVSTDFDQGVVLVELYVIAADVFDAVGLALTVVRTAIHATEGGTPDWPTVDDVVSVVFRAGEMVTKPVSEMAAA